MTTIPQEIYDHLDAIVDGEMQSSQDDPDRLMKWARYKKMRDDDER